MTFQAPPIIDFLSEDTYTLCVWLSQKDASHVGLSYLHDGIVYDFHFYGSKIEHKVINWNTLKKQRIAHAVQLDDFSKILVPAFLATVCRDVEFRYGIDWIANRGSFDTIGQYTPAHNHVGYTCATLIEALFHGIQHTIVSLDSWPSNEPRDAAWKNKQIKRFKKVPLKKDVLDDIKETLEFKHLWPSELAAAMARGQKSWPCTHGSVADEALTLIEQFNSLLDK